MKNVFIIMGLVILSSCEPRIGFDKKSDASTKNNSSAKLLSKSATRYDANLGIEVTTERTSGDSTVTVQSVWVSKIIYQRIPEPSDTAAITLYYLTAKVAPGDAQVKTSNPINIATGFDVIIPSLTKGDSIKY